MSAIVVILPILMFMNCAGNSKEITEYLWKLLLAIIIEEYLQQTNV